MKVSTANPIFAPEEESRKECTTLIHPELFSEVSKLLSEGVEEGVFPGCVLMVGLSGREVFKGCAGLRCRQLEPGDTPSQMQLNTVFDVASVTGALVTTTLTMKLVESGRLRLDDRVGKYVSNFGVYGKSDVAIRNLLAHTSGLVSWHPFYEELLNANAALRMGILTSRGARQYVLNAINRSQLKYPTGTRQVYSDVGLILLGDIIESIAGISLEKAAHQMVFKPLGLRDTSYIDLRLIRRRGIHPVRDLIAPTEDCPWRRRVLCGEVHDDNAWAMGGISGHSGVFSTARDLQRFAAEMIAAYQGSSQYLKQETVRDFWEFDAGFQENGFRLGWAAATKEDGLEESGFSGQAIGVNGFTGCSLWIEPKLGVSIVLMSNRVHPVRSNRKICAFRPRLFGAVLRALAKLTL
jgi:serine-type D-Ala-D-Ala carboxypeptidase